MPRKTLYLLCVIALLGFSASLLFIPDWFWNLYGASVDANGIWIGRFLSAVMLGNVLLAWNLRGTAPDHLGAKWYSQAQVIEWGLVAIFVAIATLAGVYGAFAWGTAGLSLLFAILFARDGFR